MTAEDITCVRCDRPRVSQQVEPVQKTKAGHTAFRCADTDECDEYHRQQKQAATWQQSASGPR
jgi:hypothetical protein